MALPTRLTRLAFGLAGVAALGGLAAPAYAWQDGWSYRTKVTLTPSQTGASGEIGQQPVLIRLHSGNFSFKDAKPDGSDLRIFAGDDKTPLKFQIEKWDAAGEVALVWVQVPGLSTGGATPIFAYYGNAKATPGGDAKGTFGGQALVWHFAEDGAAQDSSGNNVTGSANGTRDPNGLIGAALKLDGTAGIGLPTAFQFGAPATVSMWVKPQAANANGSLFAVPGGLTIGVVNGVPFVGAGTQKANGSAPLSADSWTHVAAVSDGKTTTLFINGASAGQIAGALPAGAGQASVGQGFAGDIDEVEVTKSALPAGAIALAANSQGSGAKLTSFDKPEQVDAGGHGYFGILLGALTPDAWTVIAILGVMSLISWVVMISKGLTLGRVASANDDFLDAYERAAVGQSDHDGLADLPPELAAGVSSLAHLYRVGQRELKKRIADGKATGSRYAIRAQSIAAIRSALDAAQVRESQRLNKWMVLLTIAISGGPFLGLLGTVVGVMITFAAVAAAGDVNINAIAPGIAAALLATVAGLAVAIPALFGYNYLLSRVEEISADDQIFVDELEKRIAETYQDVAPTAVAAE
jgi:biopolymer transport protein ExbB